MFIIKKPSKILLLGEHSAVYGFPVIGATIPLYMQLVYTFSDSWRYLGVPSFKIDEIIHFINNNFEKVRPIEFLIFSQIPVGLGFGSSASLSLCFAEYIVIHDEYRSYNKILLARKIEDIFHGRSSGMDILLIELGGTFYLENKNGVLNYKRIAPCNFYFLIGAVRRECVVSKIISDLNYRISLDNGQFEIIKKLGYIVRDSCVAFDKQDISLLAYNMNVANNYLKSLGLSSDMLDYVIKRGLELKALSGKLSGAGRGGAFILLFRDKNEARLCLRELSKDLDKNNICLICKLQMFRF
ncbi:Galactokinase [Borrelia miyamotoi]|uniref:Mevalonate kinase n=1 Tax=Borrelia miyamotoi TaxID=47466 RepID=A0AAP9CFI7_9SPIR|nr:mevalonate kinase [Borrelia miyamotoi]ATQ14569.1 mevalonate kinase [Borrelia miyamotoi]ATQ15754.1 mevalonate kinase [Borrelia miyamotoi]ATQ16898.1 mevalonate kinase [Borrelia miyamotoi]ATQ18597.1 mevalonate kinase [Borrelia miyamotoi]ATQ20003.1 mevalonate kinase [Borrelia miyamotoi]